MIKICPTCGFQVATEGNLAPAHCSNCGSALLPRRSASATPFLIVLAFLMGIGGFFGGYFAGKAATPATVAASPKSEETTPPPAIVSNESAQRTTCISNLKQVSTAIQIYLADYDDVYPHIASYEPVMPYLKNWDLISCPKTAATYSINMNVLGYPASGIASPYEFVVLYEGFGGEITPVHEGMGGVGFADGHAAMVLPDRWLAWQPSDSGGSSSAPIGP